MIFQILLCVFLVGIVAFGIWAWNEARGMQLVKWEVPPVHHEDNNDHLIHLLELRELLIRVQPLIDTPDLKLSHGLKLQAVTAEALRFIEAR